jgi:mannose/cellobiose epimerase-like protein (N-acyl-D-glucosamine 2-epimerase family)
MKDLEKERGDGMDEAADLPGRPTGSSWMESVSHRAWIRDEAVRLFDFFKPTLGTGGRFVELDDDGRPLPTGCPPALEPQQNLLTVARTVHTYALAELLGIPGGHGLVEAGLTALWEEHRDPVAGGYMEAVGPHGPIDATKPAYGHAFVLLAAGTAMAAGHSQGRALFDDALATIDEHFWSEEEGASREAYDRDWNELEAYRGANSNMHLCEAFLAAADVDGRPELAERAARIADKLINGFARNNGWLLPEHYTTDWTPVFDYNHDRLDDPFRPYGATVGHSVEWARLVVSAGVATGSSDPWFVEAAEALFERAVAVGWDERHGGLVYTVDWDGKPANADHYWWPIAEGIGAAAYLLRLTGRDFYERWYRRFWEFSAEVLIDGRRGGWYPMFDSENRRKVHPWHGKPDIYHAFQACLLPLLPTAPSMVGAVRLAAG